MFNKKLKDKVYDVEIANQYIFSELIKLRFLVAANKKELEFEGTLLNPVNTLERTILITQLLVEYLGLDLKAEWVDDPCYPKVEQPKKRNFYLAKRKKYEKKG